MKPGCSIGRTTACPRGSRPFLFAFSLIELLVVVAILVILMTLYWGPATGKRQKQSKALCRQNLEKLYISFQIYANEHAGKFPMVVGATNSAQALAPIVPKYSSDTSLFICPGRKDLRVPAIETFATAKIAYAYYMGQSLANPDQALLTDAQVDNLAKVAGQMAFSSDGNPPGNNHQDRGGNFLYADGHAAGSPAKLAIPLNLGQGITLLNP